MPDSTFLMLFSILSFSYSSFLLSLDLLFIALFNNRRLIAKTSYLLTLGNGKQTNFGKTLYIATIYIVIYLTYCNNLKIKLVFSSFKIKNLIRVKDYVPRLLRSCVVYKFVRNVIPHMLVKHPDTYKLVFVSIFFQIRLLMYLNISKVLMPVKMLVRRPVLKLKIQLDHTIS